MKFSRREFSRMIFGASAFGILEASTVSRILGQDKRSILWLSAQTASSEGSWTNLRVEGKVPRDLNGTLFRTAPGMSENFGVPLNHLFDGDAFMSSWRFRDGRVDLTGRFVATPQRQAELKANKMLFNEFGTFAPAKANNSKNQPSVNVVEWDGKLLGLSEGGLPTIVNRETLAFEGYENFQETIPGYMGFTAHPRFDPKTGDMYAWGFEKRPPGNMHLYRIDRKTNKATLLYKLQLDGLFMAHDSMLTENFFLLLVPPMQYDFQALMAGTKTVGDALSFNENLATRLLILPLDNKGGSAKPIEVELPPEIAFHYGNAHETPDGKIVFEMVSGNDKRLLETLRNWKRNFYADGGTNNLPQMMREVTIDVATKKVAGRVELVDAVEFPRYDLRLTGRRSRYLYSTRKAYGKNAAILRIDLKSRKFITAESGLTRTFGEPVFVPRTAAINEEKGWIFCQGYDADKNESFLEIRDAQTLEFESRIWAAGQHFPLGFHGNFYPGI